MYFARRIHSPGGATALVALIGQEELQQLGCASETSPILRNAIEILLVAFLVRWIVQVAHLPGSRA
jgi:CBS domain-containing membrane protein